jgi:hypothetical protein
MWLGESMKNKLLSIADTRKHIDAGRHLLLAGDEEALRQLPRGNWIAGTIPYFITPDQGGMISREHIYLTDITDIVTAVEIVAYDQYSVSRVYAEGPRHGFSFIILPAASDTHLSFAVNAPSYADFAIRPLIGWVAGVHLDDLKVKKPKVFNGKTGEVLEDGALVLHGHLPQSKVAEIGIINLFEQGEGDTLSFPDNGFTVTEVLVNGIGQNFASYLSQHKIDTKFPLVADYYGALVNSSIQDIDEKHNQVKLYAPVFSEIKYKLAKPVVDYVKLFGDRLREEGSLATGDIVFSCNCILNYLYSELEGKKTDPYNGPVTFGEIAYQLLNQTLVYLKVVDSQS